MRTYTVQYMFSGEKEMSSVYKVRANDKDSAMNLVLWDNKPKILKSKIDYFTIREKGTQEKSTIIINTKLKNEHDALWSRVEHVVKNPNDTYYGY